MQGGGGGAGGFPFGNAADIFENLFRADPRLQVRRHARVPVRACVPPQACARVRRRKRVCVCVFARVRVGWGQAGGWMFWIAAARLCQGYVGREVEGVVGPRVSRCGVCCGDRNAMAEAGRGGTMLWIGTCK